MFALHVLFPSLYLTLFLSCSLCIVDFVVVEVLLYTVVIFYRLICGNMEISLVMMHQSLDIDNTNRKKNVDELS